MAKAAKLSPEKWILAGLDALQGTGPLALAAEPLARDLGTTKGSFYWHFKDLPAFHAALLGHWQAVALQHIETAQQTTSRPDIQLREFCHYLLAPGPDAALRAWAQTAPMARPYVQTVDAARRAVLGDLLAAQGLGNPAFAAALHAAITALPTTSPDDPIAPCDALIDTVLALT